MLNITNIGFYFVLFFKYIRKNCKKALCQLNTDLWRLSFEHLGL